ncbi:hypothetical protein COLO4_28436 [Corchorus olitorius]|uniref:Uncharacterized protein n=1 Tax=Corchorus olitorius TaxID=93759 RepID=A0A1R3HKN1_9ROSI|nr:hypothetical protein COLO4_28436 [Corchorus olitorius]
MPKIPFSLNTVRFASRTARRPSNAARVSTSSRSREWRRLVDDRICFLGRITRPRFVSRYSRRGVSWRRSPKLNNIAEADKQSKSAKKVDQGSGDKVVVLEIQKDDVVGGKNCTELPINFKPPSPHLTINDDLGNSDQSH